MSIAKRHLLPLGFMSLALLPLLSGCQNTQPSQQEKIVANPQIRPTKTMDTNQLEQMLTQYQWQLLSATDKHNKPLTLLTQLKKPATLEFENNEQQLTYGFSVGCNDFGANVTLAEGNKLNPSNLMMTQMYCIELDSAEKKLSQLMGNKSTLTLMPMTYVAQPTAQTTAKQQQLRLQQVTADGSTLIWQGRLTDTAKYGNGQTLFLEVAPQTVHCSSGINQTCLKVREVYYDKQFIKTGTGQWHALKQPINGYQHDQKTRTILRVNKYVTEPADVKGKQLVYKLDTVVETEFLP